MGADYINTSIIDQKCRCGKLLTWRNYAPNKRVSLVDITGKKKTQVLIKI